MTVLDLPRPADVELNGRVLHGIAIPYARPSLVADRDRTGKVRVYAETWDERSAELPVGAIPLLVSHDETRPVGRIAAGALWHQDDGLHVEAVISGSSSEVEGIVARARDQVMSGLSVGFMSDGRGDQWHTPTTHGGVPSVLRRGAVLRELSLVTWPALDGAGIHRVTARTRVEDEVAERLAEQHARSQAFLAEYHHTRATVTEPPPAPVASRPRAPVIPAPFWEDGRLIQLAPELPPDPTELERQLHQRSLHNWAADILRFP